MNENLKVNSKTSILEFKRKHNKLVEKSVVKITTLNINSLSNEEINSLSCGDIVCKEDETGKHSYIVTFKKENVGICLSYFDGSGYIETVSYDYSGGNWVFNSKDVFQGDEKLNQEQVENLIEEGLISNAKPIYCHPVIISSSVSPYNKLACLIFNNSSTPFTKTSFIQWIKDLSVALGGYAKIIVTGGMTYNEVTYPACYLDSTNGGTIGLYLAGITSKTVETFINDAGVFADDVNKIN